MNLASIYLSNILNKKIYTKDNTVIGILKDLAVSTEVHTPRVEAAVMKTKTGLKNINFSHISIIETKGQFSLICNSVEEKSTNNLLLLKKYVLDKQIIDVNGRKVVRVNDIEMVSKPPFTELLVVAVDIGMEGILRRLSLEKPLLLLNIKIPSKLMLWNDVATVYPNKDIVLSKTYNTLSTLHPSDLADIIEDLDTNTGIIIFSTLDDAKAADVLEELEEAAQLIILKNISPAKAAGILQEMPADEAADILDGLADNESEELLNFMKKETSAEVRELMDYDDNIIGSLMNTDIISYQSNFTVDMVINDLRSKKPEYEQIQNIYVVDENQNFFGSIPLRDIIISNPSSRLEDIMIKNSIYMHDTEKISDLIKIITKYNLFALPIINKDSKLVGNVVINDILRKILH